MPATGLSSGFRVEFGLSRDRTKSLAHGLKPIGINRGARSAATGNTDKAGSDEYNPRDPRHASTQEASFQDQTSTSDQEEEKCAPAVTSPRVARMESLPPSLQLKRDLAVQRAVSCKTVKHDALRSSYPPNSTIYTQGRSILLLTHVAPDRPAPLSVRSRSSHMSCFTPMPNKMPRSVSTPVRSKSRKNLEPPHRSLNMQLRDNDGLVRGLGLEESQVFDRVLDSPQTQRSTPFTARLHECGERRHGAFGGDKSPLGPYQLDMSDVASDSTYSTSHSSVLLLEHAISTQNLFDGGIIGDDTFNALESYVGTDDEEDSRSLLESASASDDEESTTQYQFEQATETRPFTAEQRIPTKKRRDTPEKRRVVENTGLSPAAINFHRPLPLRSYESEATMFPTAGFQARSSRNRAKSVTSVVNSSRHVVEAMQHPPLPLSSPIRTSTSKTEQNSYGRRNSHTKISQQIDRPDSQYSSSAATIAAFPIPPMHNPVGELTMLVGRATASSRAINPLHSMTIASPENTYRAITKVHMASVLKRTRSRGEQLQVVDWKKLPNFERAWRNSNKTIIEAIYGRKDVKLEKDDCDFIDCIAMELREGEGTENDWVRRVFEAEL